MALILAFDTATPQVTVAVGDGEQVLAELRSERTMKHGEELAPLIAEALAQAGVTVQDLTGVAVGVGPGPFTGLRVGLVTARTMGYALGIPVRGVCTLDILARSVVEETGGRLGTTVFAVATDARRKEVYWAAYDEQGSRTSGPFVAKPADVPQGLPVFGEGAQLYPEAFRAVEGPLRPSAGALARAVAAGSVEILAPEPLYLRRPDAEEQVR